MKNHIKNNIERTSKYSWKVTEVAGFIHVLNCSLGIINFSYLHLLPEGMTFRSYVIMTT
jgi:hypothetical protein